MIPRIIVVVEGNVAMLTHRYTGRIMSIARIVEGSNIVAILQEEADALNAQIYAQLRAMND